MTKKSDKIKTCISNSVKPILSSIKKRIVSIYKKYTVRKNRLKLYGILFLFCAIVFLTLALVISNPKNILSIKKEYVACFVAIASYLFITLSILISLCITDSLLSFTTFLEKKYFNYKAKNMMSTYKNWVISSKYGDTYRILEYLSDENLNSLIHTKDKELKQKYGTEDGTERYLNNLRYKEVFNIYNSVILKLSQKPLYELKNLLSFLELTPKKNWFFVLIKTIIFLFIPATTFETIGLAILAFFKDNDIAKYTSEILARYNIGRIIKILLDSGTLPVLIICFIFGVLFIIGLLLMYKDIKFDEPHIRAYLKTTISRAIDVKENNQEIIYKTNDDNIDKGDKDKKSKDKNDSN